MVGEGEELEDDPFSSLRLGNRGAPQVNGFLNVHLCNHSTDLTSIPLRLGRAPKMRRRQVNPPRGLWLGCLGTAIGLVLGLIMASGLRAMVLKASGHQKAGVGLCETPSLADEEDPLSIIGLADVEPESVGNNRSLIFVGVMTAQKYLDTRALAVYETWGKELPGKIAFFSSADSTTSAQIPIVRLKGVDDRYPPQKKSFLMLEYMWKHYGQHFEWFLRADDDVYIRGDKLEKLLRSVDSRKARFVGQAGRGDHNEFGLLSLEWDENFCMGGPGVIFSRETLGRVAPHLRTCLRENLYTSHEDVEVGRCVQRYAGVPCTWSYEMQTILYHNYSGHEAFTGNLKQKEVHRAITLHPIKNHKNLYRIHNYMRTLKVQEMQQKSLNFHRDIASVLNLLNVQPNASENYNIAPGVPLFPIPRGKPGYLGDNAKLGLSPGMNQFKPQKEIEVICWDFISRSLFSDTNSNPRRRMEAALREGLDDVLREVMDSINAFSKQRGRVIDFKEVLYAYSRINPLFGADFILDLLLVYKKYRGRKMTVPVRRHAYIHRHFLGIEAREVIDGQPAAIPSTSKDMSMFGFEVDLKAGVETLLSGLRSTTPPPILPQSKVISFVLPLAGRLDAFHRFLDTYETVCLQRDEATELVVVLFPDPQEEGPPTANKGPRVIIANQTIGLLRTLQRKYPSAKISVVPVMEENFARAVALEMGAAHCKEDALLFLVDVDIAFTPEALRRIRLNTIKGHQVYFPVVFSEFDPEVVHANTTSRESMNHFIINDDQGYWRNYGFGIVSVYHSDLKAVGGMDTSIRGWGKEDVDLYEKFIRAGKLGSENHSSGSKKVKIFRAADPGLVHIFHLVHCDPNLEATQLLMCQGTRANTFGGTHQLANIIRADPNISKFARDRRKILGPT
ncbi:chondroitin sulfate synthase 1 [Hetaerina americana]|uniref:chondroitin sulfate synthase 1 n=1 Tax=Hetaerina americana TaxID=62018 RepID=UPI003A7F1E7D